MCQVYVHKKKLGLDSDALLLKSQMWKFIQMFYKPRLYDSNLIEALRLGWGVWCTWEVHTLRWLLGWCVCVSVCFCVSVCLCVSVCHFCMKWMYFWYSPSGYPDDPGGLAHFLTIMFWRGILWSVSVRHVSEVGDFPERFCGSNLNLENTALQRPVEASCCKL